MDDQLNILPPDESIFHSNKKSVSNKQKDHLIKARQKAKETMDRRKKLEEEANAREKNVVIDVKEEDDQEEEVIESPKAKPQSQTRPLPKKKVKELTEEEVDARRFAKFMKNMKTYEALKIEQVKQEEEAKKVKISLDQSEYQELVALIEERDKKLEQSKCIEKSNPSAVKKNETINDTALVRSIRNSHRTGRIDRR